MSDERDSTRDQPLPRPTRGRHIHDLVAADLQERKRYGTRKYGQPLQAFNGRSALLDAYQEVLDLAVYLRQKIEEEASCPICKAAPGEPCDAGLHG